ncbi:MAG TPA: hypothetical protein PLG94_09705 [Smithellaceae bacterium]|nr:hypothetical protein [Smithellaceae bacterium]HPL66798.1 hypothetical protein [Smithellaceae bacterium]
MTPEDKGNNRIPSRDESGKLIIQYSMLPNIVAHSIRVMEVALAIVDNLKIHGEINGGIRVWT